MATLLTAVYGVLALLRAGLDATNSTLYRLRSLTNDALTMPLDFASRFARAAARRSTLGE